MKNVSEKLDLGIDFESIRNHADYKALWEKISKVQIRMIEKNEECKHNPGDTFVYDTPYQKPAGVCTALLHVLDLYVWRIALGFPSWESDDHGVHMIHCPDKKGTVWAISRIKE